MREKGVGGAAVGQIVRDELAALVTPVRTTDVRLKRQDLHRHLAVIESAFARTTILPCPFGTVVESEADVENGLLVSAHELLLAGLARLDGNVQMNVKATYDEDELLREIVAADPEVARLRELTRVAGDSAYGERLRLGELVADNVAARSEHDAVRLLDALAPNAVDVSVEERSVDSALKASFLVSKKGLRRFDAALEDLSDRERPLLRFEAIGPLPPTAFAAAYADV
jgi:hypothetical protein